MVSEGLPLTPQSARAVRTLLMLDVVESVRLMESDENETVQRWLGLVDQVQKNVLPAHGGRLFEQRGDSLLLEFPRVLPAVQSAFAIQRACHAINDGLPPERHMLLRMGVHCGEVIVGEHDVYGRAVNLAARIATLAGPGEIVVSADVHDQLTPLLDADVEDLGECYLKHVQQPVRAYRVGPPGAWPVIESGTAVMPELRPTVAVIPFTAQGVAPEHEVLGEILADEMISALSRTAELNVISRLSTTAFRGRGATLTEVSARLNAHYLLSGAYRVSGLEIVLIAELAEAKSSRVLWSGRLRGRVSGVVSGEDELIDRVVAETSAAVIARELQRAQSQALPTLESHTLLMAAIVLMHRSASHHFDRAREMLEALSDRARRQATPHAWLAKWHVLRFTRGWALDQKAEAKLALDCTKRALDADPDCSLALTIDGFVHTNLLKRLDIGEQRYELALRVNPNDSLAWLLKGTLHAFKGEGAMAVAGTEHALKLSPLDPLRYFYESLAATAALSAGRYEHAIALAQRSLRSNRVHTSTLRVLAIAHSELGHVDEARKIVKELLVLEPTLTVRHYLERSPGEAYATGQRWAEALRRAGVPE
jgi:adenylate cyclase